MRMVSCFSWNGAGRSFGAEGVFQQMYLDVRATHIGDTGDFLAEGVFQQMYQIGTGFACDTHRSYRSL